MEKLAVLWVNVDQIRPYERNPRKNDSAVDAVAASIREFGWKVPLVIDKDGTVVTGHTRLKAAKKLGMKRVPVIIADDLTPEQVRAFRLADNKVGEIAEWDMDLLGLELMNVTAVDMAELGFDVLDDKVIEGLDRAEFFDRENRNDTSRQEGNDEYNEFLDKFEPKKTTDDCYTPDLIYDAVASWVEKEYGVKRSKFARPFYPGGDYQRENYPEGCIVVDNPPFSILSEILNWYNDNGVRFFLWAPTLTLFSSSCAVACAIPCACKTTYENGAVVNTSFLTNLEDPMLRVRTAPELVKAVMAADEEIREQQKKELPKYSYPDNVITSAMVAKWSRYGIEFRLSVMESQLISELDAQKEYGKAIYGKGYLISERAAAERAAAERAAAERAAAERAAAQRWTLSEREREIVRRLSDG